MLQCGKRTEPVMTLQALRPIPTVERRRARYYGLFFGYFTAG
jgi:hypothetical protein